MNFELSEEQRSVQQAARDFAQTELLPGVIDRDTEQKFPYEQIKKMGELGFMGMMTDPRYNGGGMDTISYVLAMEEISKIDASASVCMSVNNSLVAWGIEKFGTEDQKQRFLTKRLELFVCQNRKPVRMPPASKPLLKIREITIF
jgi:alkylation response protein AidB-like acyl-CoA dehydrogenase